MPLPVRFVGMCGVYNIAKHYAFEQLRGVANISTMARACGGAANFDAVSPAVILARAAAQEHKTSAVFSSTSAQQAVLGDSADCGSEGLAEQGGRCAGKQQQTKPSTTQDTSKQQPQESSACSTTEANGSINGQTATQGQLQGRHILHGEAIPFRAGFAMVPGLQDTATAMDARPAVNYSTLGRGTYMLQHASSTAPPGASKQVTVSSLLSCFSADAAGFLPPCILMSSCSDHMVPWHESAEMAVALHSCRVPVKHLIYNATSHNDFVLAWTPIKIARTQKTASKQGYDGQAKSRYHHLGQHGNLAQATVLTKQQADAGCGDLHSAVLPHFAEDLLLIMTDSVQVNFATTKRCKL